MEKEEVFMLPLLPKAHERNGKSRTTIILTNAVSTKHL